VANDEDLHKADNSLAGLRLKPIRQSLACLLFGCRVYRGAVIWQLHVGTRLTVATEPNLLLLIRGMTLKQLGQLPQGYTELFGGCADRGPNSYYAIGARGPVSTVSASPSEGGTCLACRQLSALLCAGYGDTPTSLRGLLILKIRPPVESAQPGANRQFAKLQTGNASSAQLTRDASMGGSPVPLP